MAVVAMAQSGNRARRGFRAGRTSNTSKQTGTLAAAEQDAIWDEIFNEWLKYTKNPDIVLPGALKFWQETNEPIYVWMAIDVCTCENVPFPEWVRDYLASCADRMLTPEAANDGDLRKALPAIMGFKARGRRGRGDHPLDAFINQKDAEVAINFGNQIFGGATPSEALRDTFDVLDARVADKMDNKTLQRRILKYYQLGKWPRKRDEWMRVLLEWGPIMMTEDFRQYLANKSPEWKTKLSYISTRDFDPKT